ncbi:MAG TPA: ribbon-helix-helix protein, CopG family [Chloroflexota bacterium]
MVRTPVQLTEKQAAALRALALRRGVSVAEIIRQAVERILEESEATEQWRRASAVVGRYRDTMSDVASRHDAYLDEAYR